ncbi:hypothetical protein Daesc_009463 [Daldinia eschscholtzii]|uniref:Uncharacterized protein n=1 Tax=Daldinia eschscholtzii TaxID=292717 RepID=A0AAX6M9N2_9PEZI
MHAFTYFVLSFIGVAQGLPTFLAEHKRDQLINLSPSLNLGLNANNDNSCLGLGISVCDPITVDSKKNSTVVNDNSGSKAKEEPSSKDNGSSGDSLINVSPDIDLGLNLSNENSCLGIGISACDPITVDSDVTNTVENVDSKAKDEPSSAMPTPTPTTAPATYPVQASPTSSASSSPTSSPTSNSNSGSTSSGNSLINLSPEIKPDLNLSNDNSCQGIGISACDPITVNSTVNSIVKNISS